jgi:Mg-chelatase subunit ChlD
LNAVHEFHYRLRQPAAGQVPGAHRSRLGDAGLEFRGHVPLAGASDLRRIDFHASLRDPLEQWQVKVFSERKAVSVMVVADLSASMGFAGVHRKLDVLADFTEAAARSAWRHGDPFGFIGCGSELLADWLVPPTRRRGLGEWLARRLRAATAQGTADGLAQASRFLPSRRSLVFVLSDFHLPVAQLDRVLRDMAAHEVVPVLLWDRHEFDPPANGLMQVADPENGAQRFVWMRPWLRQRWAEARRARREELQRLFARHRLDPLVLDDGYRADLVSAHFV